MEGRVVDANRAALDLIGVGLDAVEGEFFWETPWWQHSTDLQLQLKDAVRRAADGETVRFEATHPDDDGYLRIIDFSVRPIFNSERRVIRLLPEGTDVTEQKIAQAELVASEARLRAVFDTAIDAIVVIDETGVVETFNCSAERMLGYSAAEVIGQNVQMLMPSMWRERHQQGLKNYVGTGVPHVIGLGAEVECLRKDGSICEAELQIAEILAGSERRFLGMMRDISSRKQAEAAKRESEAHRREVQAFRATVATFSHKLSGPLTGILADLQYLKECQDLISEGSRSGEVIGEALEATLKANEVLRQLNGLMEPRYRDYVGKSKTLDIGETEDGEGLA